MGEFKGQCEYHRICSSLLQMKKRFDEMKYVKNYVHLCGAVVQQVGAVQEVLVLSPGNYRLRQLTQVQFEQRRHRVDICITVGNDTSFIEHPRTLQLTKP